MRDLLLNEYLYVLKKISQIWPKRMAKYTFQIDEYVDGIRLVDSCEFTIDAADKITAIEDIERAYPFNKGYICTLKKIMYAKSI